jgi:hypothetical protein
MRLRFAAMPSGDEPGTLAVICMQSLVVAHAGSTFSVSLSKVERRKSLLIQQALADISTTVVLAVYAGKVQRTRA